MTKIFERIKEEIVSVIPAVIFFAISFNLLVFTEKLMIRHETPAYLSYALATFTALVVGKGLIIANKLPYLNAFIDKPLFYNIVWKFMIYGSFALVFRICDKAAHIIIAHRGFAMLEQGIETVLVRPTFWAIQIWLLILFSIYIVSIEFIRVLGKEKVKKIFFPAHSLQHEAECILMRGRQGTPQQATIYCFWVEGSAPVSVQSNTSPRATSTA